MKLYSACNKMGYITCTENKKTWKIYVVPNVYNTFSMDKYTYMPTFYFLIYLLLYKLNQIFFSILIIKTFTVCVLSDCVVKKKLLKMQHLISVHK